MGCVMISVTMGRTTLRLEDKERPNGSATGSRENQIQLQIYAFVGRWSVAVRGSAENKRYISCFRSVPSAVAGGGEEVGKALSLKKSGRWRDREVRLQLRKTVRSIAPRIGDVTVNRRAATGNRAMSP
ncbi:hypothetical protein E3N88_23281 [Mikania micrantha]|uniref:Uncharacterized protein n=1 Tax=Mikania micrantha TaxID=192012 RepID=A0A5N6NEL0_9ASTR|nr:hypothetical protein E3N88_23281 [Mikania micrantha]